MRPLTIAAAATLAFVSFPAFAEDLTFTLVNKSSVGVVELYVSPHSAQEWGENILTVEALKAGERGNITITDGAATCEYDLRFVTDTGITADASQDLCKKKIFTLRD
jgi:hypothetical protein